ncbi:homocitrate synthase lys21 [Dispira simplex]|nr:homocitrate synthase lys21 [Dispira simplex]
MATYDEVIRNFLVNQPSREAKFDPLNIYEDFFAPLCGNSSIEGLVTPLYQYQRTAVARMLHQELYPSGYVPTLGELPVGTYPPELQSQPISCPHRCGKHHYTPVVNPLPSDTETGYDNVTARVRGGILAGKSRTGKILECLALILLTKDQLACPTALQVCFTIPVCNLTYQRYLDRTLLSPYHYPDRHIKRCREWENGNELSSARFVDDSIEDKPCDTELSCLPNTNIVPPLRYLTFRQILHRSDLTEKAREVLLPPDLKELLYVAGSSYLEEWESTTTYFDNPERPFPALVRHHQADMIVFTDSTPNISKFKPALAAIPFQGPKARKRLHQGYPLVDPVHGKLYPFLPMIPSRTTLVIVPENYLITWESEIKKHIAPNALKYLVVRDYSKPSVTALLESDLVLISRSELYKAYCCHFNISPEIVEGKSRHSSNETHPQPLSSCLRANTKGSSSFYQILWKRVIVKCKVFSDYHTSDDCAHISALQSERRWACLASELLSLYSDEALSLPVPFVYPQLNNWPRFATKETLELYFIDLLEIPPLHLAGLWEEIFVDSIRTSVLYISPSLLDWLLTTYVVGNHSEEMVDETTLPLCTHHTIRLNCGYHELHVYNLSLALVVTCMILDRIEGPEQGRSLYKVDCHRDLKALWYTPSVCESRMWKVKQAYSILKEVLLNPNEAGLSSTDISLLQQCQYWMEQGLRNLPLDYDGYYSDVRYYVDAWAQPPPFPLDLAEEPGFISIRRLLGNDAASHRCEERTRCLSGSTPILVAPLDDDELRYLAKEIDEHYDDTSSILPQASTISTEWSDNDSMVDAVGTSPSTNLGPSSPDGVLAARNHMKALTIRGCSSAKFTYLVNQLCVHTPHEKCVVYVNSEDDFEDVKAFMNTIKFQLADGASTKGFTFPDYDVYSWDDYGEDAIAEAIVEFTTNPSCRVIFMPTWMLFWGVDLTVATRVYFYSPVWCDSVEMQAIARVHHMGQTRPVHVETLVLCDTLEDVALRFKGKPFRMEDYETRWAESPDDKAVLALGKFLTPIWKGQAAVDDFVEQDSCETTRLETFPTNLAPGTSRIAVDISSVQPTPGDDGLQLRPEYYFDESIPLLSLRTGH